MSKIMCAVDKGRALLDFYFKDLALIFFENQYLIYVISGAVAAFLVVCAIAFVLVAQRSREKDAYYEQLQDLVQDEDGVNEASKVSFWTKFWAPRFRASGLKNYYDEKNTGGRDVAFAAALVGVVSFGLTLSAPAGLLSAIAVLVGTVMYLGFLKNRLAAKLDSQVQGFLFAFKANIQANETPERAILACIDDMPHPIREELQSVKSHIESGGRMTDALFELKNRTSSRELESLCGFIILASATGAGLLRELEIIQRVINDRNKIKSKLQSAIKTATPTIWVASITIPSLFLFLYISDPTVREFWFQSAMSWILFTAVLGLYGLGVFLVNRQINNIKNL